MRNKNDSSLGEVATENKWMAKCKDPEVADDVKATHVYFSGASRLEHFHFRFHSFPILRKEELVSPTIQPQSAYILSYILSNLGFRLVSLGVH